MTAMIVFMDRFMEYSIYTYQTSGELDLDVPVSE